MNLFAGWVRIEDGGKKRKDEYLPAPWMNKPWRLENDQQDHDPKQHRERNGHPETLAKTQLLYHFTI